MIPDRLSIVSASYLDGYRLELSFDDGSKREIDFERFLKASAHPDIRKWLDPDAFKSFRLEYGDLLWGDWELCFPIADLYPGTIDYRTSLLQAG